MIIEIKEVDKCINRINSNIKHGQTLMDKLWKLREKETNELRKNAITIDWSTYKQFSDDYLLKSAIAIKSGNLIELLKLEEELNLKNLELANTINNIKNSKYNKIASAEEALDSWIFLINKIDSNSAKFSDEGININKSKRN